MHDSPFFNGESTTQPASMGRSEHVLTFWRELERRDSYVDRCMVRLRGRRAMQSRRSLHRHFSR